MLLDDSQLEATTVVVNSQMNRQRGLTGVNSYSKDLGFPLEQYLRERPDLSWLDLCCGEGRALSQAAGEFPALRLRGLDLVAAFAPAAEQVKFSVGSLLHYRPSERFDLITCVHGLHYVGDKLGALERISSWLSCEGLFLGHLDLANLKLNNRSASRKVLSRLRAAGYEFDRRRRIVKGAGRLDFGLQYQGADPKAGPNFSGQSAVNSHYC